MVEDIINGAVIGELVQEVADCLLGFHEQDSTTAGELLPGLANDRGSSEYGAASEEQPVARKHWPSNALPISGAAKRRPSASAC
jgi:hypothetical protein